MDAEEVGRPPSRMTPASASPLQLADESVPPLELNISRPIHTTLHPDGSATLVFGGRGISLFPPGTFVLTAGRSVVELHAEGETISVTNLGFQENLCVALAG